MKDEEMAEEYVKKEGFRSGMFGELDNITSSEANKEIKQAFLAGIKAVRPQWHDLRKDENDLPKDDRYVMIATQKRVYLAFYDCCWFSHETDDIGEVYAWCEIPTFDKE